MYTNQISGKWIWLRIVKHIPLCRYLSQVKLKQVTSNFACTRKSLPNINYLTKQFTNKHTLIAGIIS